MRMKKLNNISHSPSSAIFLRLVEKYNARWIINFPILCSQYSELQRQVLSGNFGSNTTWATSRDDRFRRGLDHLEKCLFSEPESGCYNQKSFMQHGFLALQIQLFVDGDISNYESTAYDLEVWQCNQVFLLVNFMHDSGLKRSRMNSSTNEIIWIKFFLPLPYPDKSRGMILQPLKSLISPQLRIPFHFKVFFWVCFFCCCCFSLIYVKGQRAFTFLVFIIPWLISLFYPQFRSSCLPISFWWSVLINIHLAHSHFLVSCLELWERTKTRCLRT